MTLTEKITALSRWVDEADVNASRDPEALPWHRVAKVAEEAGEVIDAMIRHTGGNPRKQFAVGDTAPVIKELLDTALAALGAVEHLTGNTGDSENLFRHHVDFVFARAGLE